MTWTSEQTIRVTYSERPGDGYELSVTHSRNVDRGFERVTWKVAAHGKPGANGLAFDVEDGKRRAARAYEAVRILADLHKYDEQQRAAAEARREQTP